MQEAHFFCDTLDFVTEKGITHIPTIKLKSLLLSNKRTDGKSMLLMNQDQINNR